MQKWEDKQRQKFHDFRVENARPTLRRISRGNANTARVNATTSTPAHFQPTTSLSKILSVFQLQSYAGLLASYGYPHNFKINKSEQNLDEMLDQVAQKDLSKFLSLLSTLSAISKDVKTLSKTTKLTRMQHQPYQSISTKNMQTPSSIRKSEKAITFRVKEKTTINAIRVSKKYEPKNIVKKDLQQRKSNANEYSFQPQTKGRKSVTISHKKTRAVDDFKFVHDFPIGNTTSHGILQPVENTNKIVQRLQEKLQLLEPSQTKKTKNNEPDLQISKIKQMYLSFDSATLTSNITNIDVNQMIECLAMQVNHLIISGQTSTLSKSNDDTIKSPLFGSIVLVSPKREEPDLDIESDEMKVDEGIKKFGNMKNIEERENNFIQDLCGTDNSEEDEDKTSQCSIDLSPNDPKEKNGKLKESSVWGNSYIASFINDFSCFDNTFQGSTYIQAPQQEDLKNFVDLVIKAGGMQKEVPIIAYIYLMKLLRSSLVKQARVTKKNWRNLMLVTLIEASKIWDDQCLENHSFAGIIKPYTTLQINRLEKYLLYFLDYRLTINQKEYSEAYFELRKHICQKKSWAESTNSIRLDLQTIKKLQQPKLTTGQNSISWQRKQQMKKLLNKSF